MRTRANKNILLKGQDKKGVWWMPRYQETKKDAVNGETPWGAVSEHRSRDIRMGKPSTGKPVLPVTEYIGNEESDPAN